MLTRKKSPPPSGHVFQQTRTICEHIQDIIRMNVLTKFHENLTINMISRAQRTYLLSEAQDIIRTNALTTFHEERTINVTYRVLTRINFPTPGGHFYEDWTLNVTNLTKLNDDWTINVASRVKNALPPGGHTINVTSRVKKAQPHYGHAFQATRTIFELVQDIIRTNVLTKFLFTIAILLDIIRTNVLSKFHKDWTINLTYRVKNAPPPGGHVFQQTCRNEQGRLANYKTGHFSKPKRKTLRQTDRHTDRRTDSPITICPPSVA
ncbi:hypothetical protein DPMN_072793 [Dreissena polymorpha]|uniref:Uncharacterized protein n=1 Tax=Dreissena polymorpha TaxID=45954 RepID=A0A9D4BXZ5_DREPO|nr:hypothetical protein DPMN_072793 [Dreissena polymorpha]